MTAPAVPLTAGAPVDDVPVQNRVSYRNPIAYGFASILAAAMLLWGIGFDFEALTTFRFEARGADTWVDIPNWNAPSFLTIAVLTLLLVLGTVWVTRLTIQRRTVPVLLHLVLGTAFVFSFLVFAGAGRPTLIPLTELLVGAIALSVPLIFGAMCGLICERSGIINIAIEGQLLFGAFAASVVASVLAAPYLGLIAAPIAGALVGALLAWFAVMYRVNQIIIGVVLNTLILGLTGFLFATVLTQDRATWNTTQALPAIEIPILAQIPLIGPILFNQTVLVYLMVAVVVVLQFMLFRSRWGLRTRAVGEHPRAADTVGIAVNPRRVWNTILGGAVAGLGGASFTVGSGLAFGREMTAGTGFIALAAMILGKWNPVGAVLAALLFGFSKNLGNTLSVIGTPVPSELLLALPYLITIFAVAGFVGRVRPPAAEGIPYVK